MPKKRRLIVLNSFGPMGSTLLAGLLEKLGFGNVPFRKNGLHQYLMGEVSLNSGYMQDRLKKTLAAHSELDMRGGVSVLDRDNQKPSALTDYARVEKQLDEIAKHKFENFQDLYMACRKIYDDAVIYKKPAHNENWYIDLTVDIHRFDPDTLVQKYRENFDDVRFIHLHRDFRGWINALASQAIVSKLVSSKLIFQPHKRYADFKLYEDRVKQIPGLHIDFDDLFETPIGDLAKQLADFLDVPCPDIDFKKTDYDLYGKITPYDVAFKKFDDNVEYLKPGTLDYFEQLVNSGKINDNKPAQLKAYILYLRDLCAYKKTA